MDLVEHPTAAAALAKVSPSANGDVIVLSETSRPWMEVSGQVVWIGGEAPGLVVAARNGYSVAPSEGSIDAPKVSGGFTVAGPLKFRLLAVWPVKRTRGDSYAQILNACLDFHSSLLSSKRVVSVVKRILCHLGLPTDLPETRPARAPPRRSEVFENQPQETAPEFDPAW